MDQHTRESMEWLDWRYRVGVAEGRYRAHEPIFGVGCDYSEPNRALRLARTYAIFRRLSQMQCDTLLDVGGSEGYHAALARKLLPAQVVTSDLSLEANRRAKELFDLPAVASDAHWLPYADNSFDVILCCEVLEHVSDPVAVMCEVARMARRYAVFSTEQTARRAREREILLLLAGTPYPHSERNWFLSSDFAVVLPEPVACERQAVITDRMAELMRARQEATPEEVRGLVWEMTRLGQPTPMDHGILVVMAKGEAPPLDLSVPGDEALLEAILAHTVTPSQAGVPGSENLDAFLLSKLACPVCLEPLAQQDRGLRCEQCRRMFPVEHGIPRMHLDPASHPTPQRLARRWPRLSEEGSQLQAQFTAPRPEASRLLLHLLNIERGLLEGCRNLPAPDLDYLNSEAVRLALMAPAAAHLTKRLPDIQRAWWDELEVSEAERAALRAVGRDLLKLKLQVEHLAQQVGQRDRELARLSHQLGRIYSRWPVRVLRRLWRLVRRGN